jgi:catechol 2,3-dioxygenase-like lactoylglutathione lyase family enzyme
MAPIMPVVFIVPFYCWFRRKDFLSILIFKSGNEGPNYGTFNQKPYLSPLVFFMTQHIAMLTLLVRDYDEAIQFFTRALEFNLEEDHKVSEEKRWVIISPPGSSGCRILLAKAVGAEQISCIGNQTGGRVFLFLHTDNVERDYARLLLHGVKIIRPPGSETLEKACVFEDLYGNKWDLIEPAVLD